MPNKTESAEKQGMSAEDLSVHFKPLVNNKSIDDHYENITYKFDDNLRDENIEKFVQVCKKYAAIQTAELKAEVERLKTQYNNVIGEYTKLEDTAGLYERETDRYMKLWLDEQKKCAALQSICEDMAKAMKPFELMGLAIKENINFISDKPIYGYNKTEIKVSDFESVLKSLDRYTEHLNKQQ